MPKPKFEYGNVQIPEVALRYLERKKPVTSYSYEDVWAEEHATSFTVAKGMQLDVVRDIKAHLVEALKSGTSLKQFKKELAPLLEKKGWWGKRNMVDPKTGKIEKVQLGSSRRLDTIWRVNMRSAYMAGRWEQSQESKSHPYLIYKLGPVLTKHREQHAAWSGTMLPKDDPWWQSHYPPLGYNCNCYVRIVSRREQARLKGQKGTRTTAPADAMKQYINFRTGAMRRVPEGITPGFEWNQGAYGRSVSLALMLMDKAEKLAGKRGMEGIVNEHLAHPIMRTHYNAFVVAGLKKKKSTARMVPLGILADRYAKYAKKKGQKVASGLVVLQERLLVTKQARHARSENDLSTAQWLGLPDVLQQPDRVYWDNKEENTTILFVKKLDVGVLLLPLRFGKEIGGVPMDTVASSYVRKNITLAEMDKRGRFERLQ